MTDQKQQSIAATWLRLLKRFPSVLTSIFEMHFQVFSGFCLGAFREVYLLSVNGPQAQLIAIGIKNNTMKHINDLHVDLPIDV